MHTIYFYVKIYRKYIILPIIFLLSFSLQAQHSKVAQTPPMGWNSYNAFGATVKESEVLDNAGFMETQLKSFGLQYVVVDYCWYYPHPAALYDPPQFGGLLPAFAMDKFGRLQPAVDRFPSARRGKGFKPLAEQVHRKGLKFGIHIMRGIPRQAVAANTRIKGSRYHAADIADTNSRCTWLNHMYGVNMDKPGAQEYYNSLFRQYARWGVDYVAVDDIAYPFSEKEIAAVRKAIDLCGRPMVLSLLPGETPLAKAALAKEYADTWQVPAAFRDNWTSLLHMFGILHAWESYIGPGHFPDADNLNIGQLALRGPLGEPRHSELNRNELCTMMTLWCIARSPLMYGGDLGQIRTADLQLIQNKAVLAVNQNSSGNRQLFRNEEQVAWVADVPGTHNKYLAVFNLGETAQLIHVDLKEAGIPGPCVVTDLWTGDQLGRFEAGMRPEVLPHGARLLLISQ